MVWHDCKIDPPKRSGNYILWYKIINSLNGIDENWNQSFYNQETKIWISNIYSFWYEHYEHEDLIPYKWAEVDLPEVE